MQQDKKVIKNKHNKKRNTAFLYEIVVREITNSILEKNEQNKKFFLNVTYRANINTNPKFGLMNNILLGSNFKF